MSSQRSASTNTDTRQRLVDAGMHLLRREGPEALQARKLAAEIGASTMAVYTHFGGMTGLLDALVAESFRQFGAALAGASTTDDPMADFFVMGFAYWEFARRSPQRYRLMFGLAAPHLSRAVQTDTPVAAATFEQLVTAVRRMLDTGQLRADDPVDLAGRVWSLVHGIVLLEIVGAFDGHDSAGPGVYALTHIMGPMVVDLLVGMGADRTRLQRSLHKARDRLAAD
ncbi:TetR/AcrR family transcriptional regulator [Mycolicibacillus parakoreensis]|uniref:TetR/AcrR family transcriptional regulator n=1 Tax=Mycolicibacillus parakoreensis TaxID=1069221 RepID=A0ABY3TXZ1_9MYCO|nr:TetR/AcrR family transcriptional regulator [Mycolicibacillus parakoreensis]MCV7316303.1 TetR/AcrR family transcriptional regulator [Mycolicibacillus parakoreensis]ULN52550.1 TetR/AcrR family transcriptional regulator [Mycolicibacillus parakoreensis]